MISFACKQVEFKELLSCSFGLTKGEYKTLLYLLNEGKELNIKELSKLAKSDRSTIQKALSGLMDKALVGRRQINQESGGYFFCYKAINKQEIKIMMFRVIDSWQNTVRQAIEAW